MATTKNLTNIANVLRRDVLTMTTAAGSGHPTSCMSCAEIMSVLFFSEMKYDTKNPFNPDNDEFVLSKGHAAPILYSALRRAGCIKTELNTLRKLNSPLEGHPMPKSLSWIKVATGSLGQGLSVGVGMALAAKLQKRKFRTYVLLGDSEIAEGSVYEAAELASYYKLNNLCAIVDVNRLGQRGETMIGHHLSIYKKRFEAFGWEAVIVDGHDARQIISALSKAKNSKKPFLIIAKTFKGKGVSFLENKNGFHGKSLSSEELKTALAQVPYVKFPCVEISKPRRVKVLPQSTYNIQLTIYNLGDLVATRSAYGNALAKLARVNSQVLALDGEVSNSTYSNEVKKETPKQFVESFIAEQNMVGMAQGLSVKNYNVFASSFAAFFTRAHDQIRMAAMSSANITFCGSHAGVSIGEDGGSQMGLEDIALFRALPDSAVFYPADAVSTEKIVELCSKIKGIKYIRTTRGKTPVLYKNNESFQIGDFKILRKSKNDRVVLAGAGITLHQVLHTYGELQRKNKNVAVVDIYCIKPFNGKKFIEFAKKHGGKVVVVEDHRPEGGIGEMISSELANSGVKVKRLAVDAIPHSGKPNELLRKYGVDWKGIVRAVNKI